MLPGTADLMAGGDWQAQGRRLSCLLRSAASENEKSLHVLARGDQQSFYVHLLEPSQAKPPHPVPVFEILEEHHEL